MAAVINLLTEGVISPCDIMSWLDGRNVPNIHSDMDAFRVEFIPVFLNFLRDQTSGFLQTGMQTGLTPNKASSSGSVCKYVSPSKHKVNRTSKSRKALPSRAKTLHFTDSSTQDLANRSKCDQPSELDALLQDGSDSLSIQIKRNQRQVPDSAPVVKGNKKQSTRIATSTPKHVNFFTSPPNSFPAYDRTGSGGKYRQPESSISNRSFEVKHSEQRLCLGDYITPEVKKGKKKNQGVGILKVGSSHREQSKLDQNKGCGILDICDEEAFPSMASSASQAKQPKRRINPTRILSHAPPTVTPSPFNQETPGVFGVPLELSKPLSPFLSSQEKENRTLEEERELLKMERQKQQESLGLQPSNKIGRESPSKLATPKKNTDRVGGLVGELTEPSPFYVTSKDMLDCLVETYAMLIICNMVPNVMAELYYILQLLTLRVPYESADVLKNNTQEFSCIDSHHNAIYFSCHVLEAIVELLKLLDKGTLRLLAENPRIQTFTPQLRKDLQEWVDKAVPQEVQNAAPQSPIGSVSFQSETDNKNNFPSAAHFHIFRKQRDSLYEIIRLWETRHMNPGWSFQQTLGPRVRHILSLSSEPTNYIHFSRLFIAQLITMCKNAGRPQPDDTGDYGFLSTLQKLQPEKYKRLYERLVTPSRLGDPCPLPTFPGPQEFFRDFIQAADDFCFKQHLKNSLTARIIELSCQEFSLSGEKGDHIKYMIKEELQPVILELRVLAKFLGFLEFMPYQTTEHLQEAVIATQLAIRNKVYPAIDLPEAIRNGASNGGLVVVVPWIVEFLGMVDQVALHTVYFLTVIRVLIFIYRLLYITRLSHNSCGKKGCGEVHKYSPSPQTSLLLKLTLGWLFDHKNFPDGLFFADEAEIEVDQNEYNATIDVVHKNYSQLCCDCVKQLFYKYKILDISFDSQLKMITPSKSQSTTPSKNRLSTPCKSMVSTPSNYSIAPILTTPSKFSSQELQTPSKCGSYFYPDTPVNSPAPVHNSEEDPETTVRLDCIDFVDFQMISLCCPYVCELKNLLCDYAIGIASKGTNSFRKITPLTASEKTNTSQSEKQIQLQLEDNFFHNNPPSVRKSVEFLSERISSKVIKLFRSQVMPEFKASVMEQLRPIIESKVHNSCKSPENIKSAVHRQVSELSHGLAVKARTKCFEIAKTLCQEHVTETIRLLMPPDITEKGINMCNKVVSRQCHERVTLWLQAYMAPSLITKDLHIDADKLLHTIQKAADIQETHSLLSEVGMSTLEDSTYESSVNQSSVLDASCLSTSGMDSSRSAQPGAKDTKVPEVSLLLPEKHNEDAPVPSSVLSNIKNMVGTLVTNNKVVVTRRQVKELLEDVVLVVTQRRDITTTVVKTLAVLLVDLAVALVTQVPSIVDKELEGKFLELLGGNKSTEEGTVMMCLIPGPSTLRTVLCPRTFLLLGQKKYQAFGEICEDHELRWKCFASLLFQLLNHDLLTLVDIHEQCQNLLQQKWPQTTLQGFSHCLQEITAFVEESSKFDDDTRAAYLKQLSWISQQLN
ncbi:codanin-1 like protein dlt [Oratosquilla oratoria]|uniref:codanin-1 like protein dlt n=1 Tax=Oratosquilla oratoria TaxID=337810 RepID=UPI003F75C848